MHDHSTKSELKNERRNDNSDENYTLHKDLIAALEKTATKTTLVSSILFSNDTSRGRRLVSPTSSLIFGLKSVKIVGFTKTQKIDNHFCQIEGWPDK